MYLLLDLCTCTNADEHGICGLFFFDTPLFWVQGLVITTVVSYKTSYIKFSSWAGLGWTDRFTSKY